jgi:gluconate 2-dehydrogenase gamma chain
LIQRVDRKVKTMEVDEREGPAGLPGAESAGPEGPPEIGSQPRPERGISRRALLARGGGVLGGIAVAGAAGLAAPQAANAATTSAPAPEGRVAAGYPHEVATFPQVPLRYFSAADAAVVGALADRIFPADHNGPGATDLGVVTYIDGQLAGAWGTGERMYRQGPFFTPSDTGHGWQYAMTPSDAYRVAIDSLNKYTEGKYGGSTYDELTTKQQDAVLAELAAGTVATFTQITALDFFTLFFENVKEGIFADPLYGGNRGVEGWKLIRFPGDPMARGDNNFRFVTDYDYYPPGPPLAMVLNNDI